MFRAFRCRSKTGGTQMYENVVLRRGFMRAHRECLGCWQSGESSGPSWDAVEQPVSERLAAVLKELSATTFLSSTLPSSPVSLS
jgi:hypothetical protein